MDESGGRRAREEEEEEEEESDDDSDDDSDESSEEEEEGEEEEGELGEKMARLQSQNAELQAAVAMARAEVGGWGFQTAIPLLHPG